MEASMRALAIALLAAVAAAPAAAQEKPVTLKKGAGLEQVEANCGACHSLDYIQMNSPFMASATWDAEIAKMIKVFGAPISEADARAIGDYLKANYGSDHVTENR
jgi:sulfite dehydrogenase (cytochrome) subunit B